MDLRYCIHCGEAVLSTNSCIQCIEQPQSGSYTGIQTTILLGLLTLGSSCQSDPEPNNDPPVETEEASRNTVESNTEKQQGAKEAVEEPSKQYIISYPDGQTPTAEAKQSIENVILATAVPLKDLTSSKQPDIHSPFK